MNNIINRTTSPKYLIILTYTVFCLSSAIIMFVSNEVKHGLMALLFILLSVAVIIGEKVLKLEFPILFIILVLLLCAGGLSGTIYELYVLIPYFDNILHGLSGFIFACLGFVLMKHFTSEDNKSFYACLMFAVSFSLAIAVIWELFEYSTAPFGFDMLEDTIVNDIGSFLLSGGHKEVVNINGITQTIIYYGDGNTYVIDGYLDIGIIDTITDMFICLVGALVFEITLIISNIKLQTLNELLVPKPNN